MIRIYGHSDDVVVVKGDVVEELGAFGRRRCITIGGEGEGVEVRAEYAPKNSKGATWQFSINLLDEDVPCPWPIRIETEHVYSQAVVIDCPPGTPVDFGEAGE